MEEKWLKKIAQACHCGTGYVRTVWVQLGKPPLRDLLNRQMVACAVENTLLEDVAR